MQSRLNKNKKGYGYEYTDLAQINKLIEENGQSYYQFIDSVDGNDYIWTVKVDEEGKESKPIRGCKVLESGALVGQHVFVDVFQKLMEDVVECNEIDIFR